MGSKPYFSNAAAVAVSSCVLGRSSPRLLTLTKDDPLGRGPLAAGFHGLQMGSLCPCARHQHDTDKRAGQESQ
jgi:hypothetical protein